MKRKSMQSTQKQLIVSNPLSLFDQNQLISKQKKLGILYNHCLSHHEAKMFSKVKYCQSIYQVGEYIHLFDRTQLSPYVVKICSIIKIPDSYEKLPFLEVEWMLKKSDLPQQRYEKYMNHFSIAEVFPCGQKQYVYMESIQGKCYVLSDKEYEDLRSTADNIYFFRASFDRANQRIKPQPDTWPSQCICKMPVNPDLEYILCSFCQKWFHLSCVSNEKNRLHEEDYKCKKCCQSAKK